MSQIVRTIPSSGPGSGTVTSISAGTGITLTPNPITTTGTVALTVPVVVSNGGTGRTTLTNHGLLVGAGTSAITQLGAATDGQIPIGSTGADPVLATLTQGTGITITNGAGSITIAASSAVAESFPTDSGTATPAAGVLDIVAGNATIQCGSSVFFHGATNVVQLAVTDLNSNTIIGGLAGNLTLSGTQNTSLGASASTALTSGGSNTVIGHLAGSGLTSGSSNVFIGDTAGANITTTSGNIIIGTTAVLADANTTRIGFGQSKYFAAGIRGTTPSVTDAELVIIDSAGQLGSLAAATNGQIPIGSTGANPVIANLTAGTGISIANGAGSITISASGTTTLNYTNVNSTPYVVLTTDDYLSVDCSGGTITVQLPNAATLGKVFVIKDRTGSANSNAITVTTVGGAVNIDGATTYLMNTQYASIQVIGNGSSYEIF